VCLKFILLLVQQSKMFDLQDTRASSTTLSLLRQFYKLVLDKILLTPNKRKPSYSVTETGKIIFMHLFVLICLCILLTCDVMDNELSSNTSFRQLLKAVFFINSQIIYITLCNSDTSRRCHAFAKICVVTQLSYVFFLKDYVVQVNAGVTSIKLSVSKLYLLWV
jgi:hypothetical protein